MHIVPIASGKGGVGKSLVAANLSIALAQAGKTVYLADLDLGASNLHLSLGIAAPRQGIGTFLSNAQVRFDDIVLKTDIPGLSFIPGDAEIPGLANIRSQQKNQLIKRLISVDADYLVLDLGAGTGSNILDFFLMSAQGIVVTSPALTATLNAYLFLKNAIFRLMYTSFKPRSKAFDYLEGLRKDGSSLQKVYVPAILDAIKEIDQESWQSIMAKLSKFRPRLIMNLLEDPKDAVKAQKIRRSAKEYLNIEIEHLGVMYRDELQEVALSSRIPIVRYKPQSLLAQAIYRIADKVVQAEAEGDAPLSLAYYDESFQAAGMEAEIDFEAKIAYVEELLASGALTTGDLVETIRSQQYEIAQLRKESALIKLKLSQAIQQGYKP